MYDYSYFPFVRYSVQVSPCDCPRVRVVQLHGAHRDRQVVRRHELHHPLHHVLILCVQGSQVKDIIGSQENNIKGSQVNNIQGSQVNNIQFSQVNDIQGSQVNDIQGPHSGKQYSRLQGSAS